MVVSDVSNGEDLPSPKGLKIPSLCLPQPKKRPLLHSSSKKTLDHTLPVKKKKLRKNLKKNNPSSSSQSFAACSSKPKQLMLSQFLEAMSKNMSDLSGGDDQS